MRSEKDIRAEIGRHSGEAIRLMELQRDNPRPDGQYFIGKRTAKLEALSWVLETVSTRKGGE